jgi:flagellar biogenesis protein FliO
MRSSRSSFDACPPSLCETGDLVSLFKRERRDWGPLLRCGIVWLLLVSCAGGASAETLANERQPDTSAESTSGSPALRRHSPTGHAELGRKPDGAGSLFTVLVSLALVLGLFFAVIWAFRRAMPAGAGPLPTEAFETLGRAPLAGRQQVHLLRCGGKLLLISVGAAGVAPLAEITDPAEVDRLTTLCRQSRANGTAGLRQMFRQKEASHE